MLRKKFFKKTLYAILFCELIILSGAIAYKTDLIDFEIMRRPHFYAIGPPHDWKTNYHNSLTGTSLKCPDCNIILIVISNLRPDHLGCYGYFRNTTPNMDSLAASGFLFQNVFTNSINELAGHMSLFTGLLPKSHQVFTIYEDNLSPDIPTLPEVLKEHGYTTIWSTTKTNAHLDPQRGFDRGFDHYMEHPHWENAIRRIDQNPDEKFFLFMHTAHTHDPYFPPLNVIDRFTESRLDNIVVTEEDLDKKLYHFVQKKLIQDPSYFAINNKKIIPDNYLKLFEGDYTKQKRAQLKNLTSSNRLFFLDIRDRLYWESINLNSSEDLENVKALYDATIFSVDESIGRLLNTLRKNGLLGKTIIAITSITGEEFMEHGRIDHVQLYDEVIGVPLIISIPNSRRGVIDARIQTVDIMPTLLALIGKDIPEDIQGMSILPLMSMSKNTPHRFFTTTTAYDGTAYRSDSWKWIIKDGREELYNLKVDPGEKNNLLR